MSVFWYVDEGSRPARLEALITLIAIGRTLPGQPMGSTIIRQVEWWNRRVDHTPLPSGRPAQIRYRLRLRSSTPEERRAPGIEEAPSGAAHEGALNRWVGSRSYYSSGFAVILHGSLGLGFGRSQTPTNIVHYTFDDGWSDRDHETHRLAHELGHLLGLADRYSENSATRHRFVPRERAAPEYARTRPGAGWDTRSDERWEGNLMADIVSDEPHVPPRLAAQQLRSMAAFAVRAAGNEGRVQCGTATYFGRPWSMRKMVLR